MWIFVKRDISIIYKQTILGPFWLFIQPLLTTIVFTVIFGKVAKIPTDGLPKDLFYMGGIVAWNYFSNCLSSTSNTFTSNASLFGKVYFPRIIVPLSKVISGLLRFGIQFLLFFGFYSYYLLIGNDAINPSSYLLIPLLILQMAVLGLGIGLLVSSMTIKYRDLTYLVSFGTQLMMYASPIVYPLSIVPDDYKNFIFYNPMTPIIEGFRFSLFGTGNLEIGMWVYSIAITLFIFFFGIIVFNKVEKNFIDKV